MTIPLSHTLDAVGILARFIGFLFAVGTGIYLAYHCAKDGDYGSVLLAYTIIAAAMIVHEALHTHGQTMRHNVSMNTYEIRDAIRYWGRR